MKKIYKFAQSIGILKDDISEQREVGFQDRLNYGRLFRAILEGPILIICIGEIINVIVNQSKFLHISKMPEISVLLSFEELSALLVIALAIPLLKSDKLCKVLSWIFWWLLGWGFFGLAIYGLLYFRSGVYSNISLLYIYFFSILYCIILDKKISMLMKNALKKAKTILSNLSEFLEDNKNVQAVIVSSIIGAFATVIATILKVKL